MKPMTLLMICGIGVIILSLAHAVVIESKSRAQRHDATVKTTIFQGK